MPHLNSGKCPIPDRRQQRTAGNCLAAFLAPSAPLHTRLDCATPFLAVRHVCDRARAGASGDCCSKFRIYQIRPIASARSSPARLINRLLKIRRCDLLSSSRLVKRAFRPNVTKCEAGSGGRDDVADERCRRVRPRRVVLVPRRWDQAAGEAMSALRPTCREPEATEAIKPALRGERAISRKTIAQGMPDCFG
jgi:hypothetical protein